MKQFRAKLKDEMVSLNIGTNFTWQPIAKLMEKDNVQETWYPAVYIIPKMHDFSEEIAIPHFETLRRQFQEKQDKEVDKYLVRYMWEMKNKPEVLHNIADLKRDPFTGLIEKPSD